MHVTDPDNFPPSPNATYMPHAALLPSAQAHASRILVPNLVFVQPSTYGLSNACLISALRAVGPLHARGVVVIDPATTPTDQLREWHALGVRGVRVNLKSVGTKLSRAQLRETLAAQARAIRPLHGWALQVYCALDDVVHIAEAFEAGELGAKVVVDHLASVGPELFEKGKRAESAEWAAFMRFLSLEGAYTKVSGPYRLSKDPRYDDLEGVVREVLAARQGRAAVFASDWPHTRFEGTDVGPWMERCLEWCEGGEEGERLRDKLFRDNARELWDVEGGLDD
jgi:predicted TIM-barrel fold metal-dependent hydrolase